MEERFEELLKFSEDFRVAKEKEEEKLPYHINVIDELHINENAHSRVLTKLLQYKKGGKEYVILQSLLDNIVEKSSDFKRIKIAKPTITQEKERIDLWICDEDYAIIFENKIYNAADQDAQICRYIERTKEKKYQEGQIFVIYLSRDGKEPDEQSWGSYKESFKSRYVNLSFRYDILPWLKNDVIPNVRQKDVYLLSALQQYIFFLEGDKMFRTSEIYKNMDIELKKIISSHLELEKKRPAEQVHLLNEKISAVTELKSQMESLKEQIQIKYIANIVDSNKGALNINVEDYRVTTAVEDTIVKLNADGGGFYCTICYKDNKNIEDSILLKFIDDNILDISNNKEVRKYLSTDIECYEDLFKLFLKVIEKYRDVYLIQQRAIKELKEKLQSEWWIWHGWDLGISFNDNTDKRIGIESWFEEAEGNACAKFRIDITTWNSEIASATQCWEIYKDDIINKYSNRLPEYKNNRVYLRVAEIDGNNTEAIIDELTKCYNFLKDLAEAKK